MSPPQGPPPAGAVHALIPPVAPVGSSAAALPQLGSPSDPALAPSGSHVIAGAFTPVSPFSPAQSLAPAAGSAPAGSDGLPLEDGGGVGSSADWSVPRDADLFRANLRSAPGCNRWASEPSIEDGGGVGSTADWSIGHNARICFAVCAPYGVTVFAHGVCFPNCASFLLSTLRLLLGVLLLPLRHPLITRCSSLQHRRRRCRMTWLPF